MKAFLIRLGLLVCLLLKLIFCLEKILPIHVLNWFTILWKLPFLTMQLMSHFLPFKFLRFTPISQFNVPLNYLQLYKNPWWHNLRHTRCNWKGRKIIKQSLNSECQFYILSSSFSAFSLSAKDHKDTFVLSCILETIKMVKIKWNQIFPPIYINLYIYVDQTDTVQTRFWRYKWNSWTFRPVFSAWSFEAPHFQIRK